MERRFKLSIEGMHEQFPFYLRIINLEGHTVFEQKIEDNKTVIAPRLLPATYVLKFKGKALSHAQKLTIE